MKESKNSTRMSRSLRRDQTQGHIQYPFWSNFLLNCHKINTTHPTLLDRITPFSYNYVLRDDINEKIMINLDQVGDQYWSSTDDSNK